MTNIQKMLEHLTLPAQHKRSSIPIIALEGHNGAGKSSLAKMISQHFHLPRYFGVPDDFLSNNRKKTMIMDVSWQSSALYFLSGVATQIERLLCNSNSNLNNSDFILIERSLWSTLSSHFSEDPYRLNILINILSDLGIELFEPDYTIILDSTFENCEKNIGLKSDLEEKQLDSLILNQAYYQKESIFYSWLKKQRSGSIFSIDVTGKSLENIFEIELLEIIQKILGIK